MLSKTEDNSWSEERDGYTHTLSGMRVVPCGPATYAVMKGGRQVRTASGRLRRWLNLSKAREFVVNCSGTDTTQPLKPLNELDQNELKSELEVIKAQFKEMESDPGFQARSTIYLSDENKRLASLNTRANQLRGRLKHAFGWLDPDNKSSNWMI